VQFQVWFKRILLREYGYTLVKPRSFQFSEVYTLQEKALVKSFLPTQVVQKL